MVHPKAGFQRVARGSGCCTIASLSRLNLCECQCSGSLESPGMGRLNFARPSIHHLCLSSLACPIFQAQCSSLPTVGSQPHPWCNSTRRRPCRNTDNRLSQLNTSQTMSQHRRQAKPSQLNTPQTMSQHRRQAKPSQAALLGNVKQCMSLCWPHRTSTT